MVVCDYIDNPHLRRPFKPSYTTCGTCRHFQPTTHHPKMGRCAVGVKSNAASSLHWDISIKCCDKHDVAER